jgi:Subtilase family
MKVLTFMPMKRKPTLEKLSRIGVYPPFTHPRRARALLDQRVVQRAARVFARAGLRPWANGERQPYVAVAAPGMAIGGVTRTGAYLPGGLPFATEAAAAFASGEAALVRARYPSMPWQQVVQRIIATTLPEGKPVPNRVFGYGIIRLAGAVDASRYPVPAPDPV